MVTVSLLRSVTGNIFSTLKRYLSKQQKGNSDYHGPNHYIKIVEFVFIQLDLSDIHRKISKLK